MGHQTHGQTQMSVAEAHARGAADGRAGIGAVQPRDPELKRAYMQSYRDALVARVGVPERRRKNPRAAPKDPAGMPAAAINRELDRLDTTQSQITTELIAAGRGYEKIQDSLKKTDPLSMRLRANTDRSRALRHEIERRYGPGAPSRLPRGVGPIRALNPRKRAPRRRPKITTTVTKASTKTVRKINRAAPRPLVVLYASKPGMRRLKYLGHGKFGEKGKPMLFKTRAGADLAAWVLRDSHPQALRGWTLTAA